MLLNGIYYKYTPHLSSGYYSDLLGWFRLKGEGEYVYNLDEKGKPFFNKIIIIPNSIKFIKSL